MTLLDEIRERARRLFAADEKIEHVELFTDSGSSMGRIRRQDVMADFPNKAQPPATCGTCACFRTMAGAVPDPDEVRGDCHRFPPSTTNPRWPAVSNTTWCGEWRAAGPALPDISRRMLNR